MEHPSCVPGEYVAEAHASKQTIFHTVYKGIALVQNWTGPSVFSYAAYGCPSRQTPGHTGCTEKVALLCGLYDADQVRFSSGTAFRNPDTRSVSARHGIVSGLTDHRFFWTLFRRPHIGMDAGPCVRGCAPQGCSCTGTFCCRQNRWKCPSTSFCASSTSVSAYGHQPPPNDPTSFRFLSSELARSQPDPNQNQSRALRLVQWNYPAEMQPNQWNQSAQWVYFSRESGP